MNARDADTAVTARRRVHRRARLGAFTLTAAAAAILAAGASAAPGDLDLVTRADGLAGAPGDSGSSLVGRAGLSANGAVVAFSSEADNLSSEDDDSIRNVYARNLATGTTTLVNRATGPTGAAASGNSGYWPAISADGRYVAFESDGTNLSSENDDTVSNIYVRDLLAGVTTLVSRAPGPGGAGANDNSFSPTLSADGRHVVFESEADNLSTDDNNGVRNLFVRDLVANTTTLVSRAPGLAGDGANGASVVSSISDDGTRVAFSSGANNLSTEDDNSVFNVFVRDLTTGTVTLVSRATGFAGTRANGSSAFADISPSGRYVAFGSPANNLSTEDDNSVSNIFLRDLELATTTLVSRADGPAGAPADGSPAAEGNPPVVSDNARVAFSSDADNLSAIDDNSLANVFLRDVGAGTTELINRGAGAAGAIADGTSGGATMTPDGRYVAFVSLATNLLAGTVPGVVNIYRRDVLGDTPVATPACKSLPLPPAPSTTGATFTLTTGQLGINQRIGQASIRRLNAVEARLSAGLGARDLCGYAIGPSRLGATITTGTAGGSLAPVSPADPAPITDPGRQGPGGTFTLTAAQLLINQRIYQAAIRRADGIESRIDAGLTGGDLGAGAVTQGKLYDRLQVLASVAGPEPAASVTVIPPRTGTGNPSGVTLSVAQLEINQRIAQAAVRRANALIRRLETGLSGDDLRPGTLAATDLG